MKNQPPRVGHENLYTRPAYEYAQNQGSERTRIYHTRLGVSHSNWYVL